MLPVSLDVAVLRLQAPELILRPGMSVVARVASRGEGSAASLVLAGALLKATVPESVTAGETLRLTVAETSPERVVLHMDANALPSAQPVDAAAAALAGAPPPPTAFDPHPDGEPERRDAGASAYPTAMLTYETPALGRLDLRIERGPDGVNVTVGSPAGILALADSRAQELRAALEARLNTQATVRIAPRREPFDAYA